MPKYVVRKRNGSSRVLPEVSRDARNFIDEIKSGSYLVCFGVPFEMQRSSCVVKRGEKQKNRNSDQAGGLMSACPISCRGVWLGGCLVNIPTNRARMTPEKASWSECKRSLRYLNKNPIAHIWSLAGSVIISSILSLKGRELQAS